MGMGQEWKCSNCDYTILTSGPHEFYRDKSGQLKPYGHPGASTKEAEEAGIKGFYVHWYCPECRQVEDVILAEFGEARDELTAWGGLGEPSSQHEPLCPKCSTELKHTIDENDICPKCNKGNFELSGSWIS